MHTTVQNKLLFMFVRLKFSALYLCKIISNTIIINIHTCFIAGISFIITFNYFFQFNSFDIHHNYTSSFCDWFIFLLWFMTLDVQVLVYEYMSNIILRLWLHEMITLYWRRKVKIDLRDGMCSFEQICKRKIYEGLRDIYFFIAKLFGFGVIYF